MAGTYVAEAWPEDRRKMGAGYLQSGYYFGFFFAAGALRTAAFFGAAFLAGFFGADFLAIEMRICGAFPLVRARGGLIKGN